MFWELRTTIGMTMVVTAGIVAVLLLTRSGGARGTGRALWVLLGVGLLTKFAVIPLFAVWWWWTTVRRARGDPAPSPGRPPGVLRAAADLVIPIGIALALCLPFGVTNVVRETPLFNGDLDKRADHDLLPQRRLGPDQLGRDRAPLPGDRPHGAAPQRSSWLPG